MKNTTHPTLTRAESTYTVTWSGYVALGTGSDPATQRDADQYDTPPDGYFDLAHEELDITPLNGRLPYLYATEDEARRVARFHRVRRWRGLLRRRRGGGGSGNQRAPTFGLSRVSVEPSGRNPRRHFL